jgi:CHAT domain-containing protein
MYDGSALRILTAVPLLVLMTVIGLPPSIAPAEAQGRGGARPGTGSRLLPPDEVGASQERAGKYGFSVIEILEAIDRGEGRQALEAYEKAASEAEGQRALTTAVQANTAAAFVAMRLGMIQKTLRAGTRALDLAPGAPPSAAVTRAALFNYVNVGQGYRLAGDLAQARRYLDEGLGFARAGGPGFPRSGVDVEIAIILRALSQVTVAQGDQAAGIVHAQEAARILESIDFQNTPEPGRSHRRRHTANTFIQIAQLALDAQRVDDAVAALGKAAQYARLVGLKETEAEVLLMSGQVALQRQKADEALKVLRRGRAQAERAGATRLLVDFDRVSAQAYERLGKVDEAFGSALSALGRVEEIRGELQDAGLRAGFLEGRQELYQMAVRLALSSGKPAEAFALAERSRARAFLDLLGNQTVLSKGRTGALVQEEVRLRAQLGEATALAQARDGDAPVSKLARERQEGAERDYGAFRERVRRENVEQASLMSVEPVTLGEIQGLLPEGTTLLEYLVVDREVVLWVVDRQSVRALRTPATRAALVTEVRDFRAAIASQAPQADVESRARALYQRLLAPAREAIRGDRLLIVPHDVLHYLPFGALRTPDGHWLVEDFVLGTVPSASVLKFLTGKGAHASDRILAIGNPDLGPAFDLHYAEREARAIAERFPSRTTVLTRAQATENRTKQLAVQAGLLHFAVHGELSEQDPMSSALLLVPGQGEDGRLEVRELFALELGAQLVVLSACETGLGKLSRGDELVGLQRAFLYAGTPAVVTTLWKVDDRASYLLMRSFYEHLVAQGPAAALRTAQRALLVTFPHPYAWAAFGLTGAPR